MATNISRRAVLALPLALAACSSRSETARLRGAAMGTQFNIVGADASGAFADSTAQAAVRRALATVDTLMSNWNATSEISEINALGVGESRALSPELAELFSAADEVHRASAGQFDLTLGPLIELWGFGAAGGRKTPPSDTEMAAALEATGQGRAFDVSGNTISKKASGASIYLSGIGKGFGVDAVAASLASLGVQDYLVEIGGDLVTAGRNPDGGDWRIGIETPDATSRSPQKVVYLSGGMALATSGDYRNYFEKDGVRYSHILNAQNGLPVTHNTASATVIAENAMLADAWATAMLALGRERGMEIAESQGLAALFIERRENGFVSTETPAFTALQA